MLNAITTRKTDEFERAVSAATPATWAEGCLRDERGHPFSLKDHLYELEWLAVTHPRMTLRKSRQVGGTLAFMIKILHALYHGIIKVGATYLFPTTDKVTEFSETRWTPFLQYNAHVLAPLMRRTNNKHNKRIRGANLMFRGARLSQKIGGLAADSASLRGDPSDATIYDERDLMPPGAVQLAHDGMLHSDLQWDWDLSNPTIPNYGIDKAFTEGDQRYWMVRCRACNAWWAPDYEFPQIMQRRADGTAVLACLKCGATLDPSVGQWVARHPDRSKEHLSYMASQLIRRQTSITHLLNALENPPDGDLAYVMRFTFGRAYVEATNELTPAQVLLCCQPAAPAWTHSAAVALAAGVDVGKVLHCVLGRRIGPDVYQVVALHECRDWKHLWRVFDQYAVQVASIDNEPELHAAREFQRQYHHAQIWLSDYVESVRGAAYDHPQGIVRVNRTEILDETHAKISIPGKFLLPSPNTTTTQFAQHCANLVKVVEKDPLSGQQRATYLSRGPDHWRHAFANFLLAARQQVATIRTTETPANADEQHRTSGGFNLFSG